MNNEDKKRLFLEKQEKSIWVLGAGLEPAQPQWSQDFKSCVSTIPPSERTEKQLKNSQIIFCNSQKEILRDKGSLFFEIINYLLLKKISITDLLLPLSKFLVCLFF